MSAFLKVLKTLVFIEVNESFRFNPAICTDPTPGMEITLYDFPNPNKTKDFVEIS